MNFAQFIRLFTPDSIKLSMKGKLLAVFFCFVSLLMVAFMTQLFLGDTHNPILVASMGASAVILFIIPNSPLAQPWAFAGGQIISAIFGIYCAQTISDTVLAASVAGAGSVFLMLLFRCLHPPATATALTPIMGGNAIMSLGYGYALIPVAMNVMLMLAIAIAVNRWLMNYDYPVLVKTIDKKAQSLPHLSHVAQNRGVSEQDMLQALEKNDVFLDITATELSKILISAELYSFQRLSKKMTCAEIMVKNVVAVEYGTEVEDAWKIMLEHNLKAVPVIDRARRVIGMITWHDFFKFINLQPYQSLAERVQTFIRRTRDISTKKPEAVGHLMTTAVAICQDSCHVAELIPLMTQAGHRQIPIVDSEQRLVGIVYQTDLIAALYYQQLATQN